MTASKVLAALAICAATAVQAAPDPARRAIENLAKLEQNTSDLILFMDRGAADTFRSIVYDCGPFGFEDRFLLLDTLVRLAGSQLTGRVDGRVRYEVRSTPSGREPISSRSPPTIERRNASGS